MKHLLYFSLCTVLGGYLGNMLKGADIQQNIGQAKVIRLIKPDTIPSMILISHEPPAFTHIIDGYCVYKDSVCTGRHLRYWRKKWINIGPEFTVWGCRRRK